MTRKRYDELSPAGRRWVATAALLRAAASVTVLVVVYYLLPLDRPVDTGTVIEFVLGLAVLVAVVAWQVRAIIASDMPRLRAVQAMAVGLPLLLLLFASTYVLLAQARPDSFNEALGRTDALYFTVTVFATVGFGDIVPVSEVARIVTMIQMIMGLIAVGLVARIVLGAVQAAVRRRDGEDASPMRADGHANPSRSGGPDHGSSRAEGG